MSRHSRTAHDWGFAALATVCVLAALAAGAGVGSWLALAKLTEDPAVATHTIVRAAVVVAVAADLMFMARVARALRGPRGRR